MKGILKGSKLFASVCLILAALSAAFGYLIPEVDAAVRSTAYAFAVVLAALGAGVLTLNYFNPQGAEWRSV